jgi:hypothetical protein
MTNLISKIAAILILLACMAFAGAETYNTIMNPWTGRLDYVNGLNFSSWNRSQYRNTDVFDSILVLDNITGNSSWQHTSYPAACPAGTAITKLGDSVICTSTLIGGNATGSYNFTGSVEFNITRMGPWCSWVNSTGSLITETPCSR